MYAFTFFTHHMLNNYYAKFMAYVKLSINKFKLIIVSEK